MIITSKTATFAILGNPIGHSLSPLLHNMAFVREQMDAVYVAFAVAPDHLLTAIKGMVALEGLQGLNITIPHKTAIIPALMDLTPEAKAVGAVNTLRRERKGFRGHNTDVSGFYKAIAAVYEPTMKVLLIGSGGAARSVVAAVRGCKELRVMSRNLDASHWVQGKNVQRYDFSQYQMAYKDVDLVINATPLGMSPHIHQAPPMAFEQMRAGGVVVDLVYRPLETLFLKSASEHGLTTIDGLWMLLYQASDAWEFWFDKKGPVDFWRDWTMQHTW